VPADGGEVLTASLLSLASFASAMLAGTSGITSDDICDRVFALLGYAEVPVPGATLPAAADLLILAGLGRCSFACAVVELL
jgi:hypothetical protein